jgi:hypothetical protein
MNFPNDNSTQTGVVNVSYTPTYANVNNPNILFNDLIYKEIKNKSIIFFILKINFINFFISLINSSII